MTRQQPFVELWLTGQQVGALQACWQAQTMRTNGTLVLHYSPDGGETWQVLADGLPQSGCQVIGDTFARADWPLLRVEIAEGARQATDLLSLSPVAP